MAYPAHITPPANTRLLNAVRAISFSDTLETREAVYKALLEGTLLVLASPAGVDGGPNLIISRAEDGQPTLLVFTDEYALHLWQAEEVLYFVLLGADLCQLAVQSHIPLMVINPAGPVGMEIAEAELRLLAEGYLPTDAYRNVAPKGTEVMIVAPDNVPSAQWVDRLQSFLAQHPQIAAAYLFVMAVGTEPPHLTVGVQFAELPEQSEIEQIMWQLVNNISAVEGSRPTFIVLAGNILDTVQQTVQPCFQRE